MKVKQRVPLNVSCHAACYRPQTKFAQVMFSQESVCPQGGCVWRGHVCMAGGVNCRGACMAGGHVVGGMHDGGACMAGGMCGRGRAWQGVCMVGGHVWQGDMCG